MRGAYWIFTKKSKYFPKIIHGHFEKTWILYQWNQTIICNNSGVRTSQIELTDLAKARKSKKHSSFSEKYCNFFFSFFIFSQLLPVLAPASFSSLLSVVKISLSYQDMYIWFRILCFIISRCSLVFRSFYCRLLEFAKLYHDFAL